MLFWLNNQFLYTLLFYPNTKKLLKTPKISQPIQTSSQRVEKLPTHYITKLTKQMEEKTAYQTKKIKGVES